MAPKLSIITAVHNSLAMNRLYWSALSKNTTSSFELIVVDNHSTDGSETFFKKLSETHPDQVTYIRNEKNQSYPASQIQGMRYARAPIYCFLNNDLWMPWGWNEAFERKLEWNTSCVLSPTGQEAQPRQSQSDFLKAKWRRLTFQSRIWKALLFKSEEQRLWKSLEWMYGDLENFKSPTAKSPDFPGIKGDCVVFHRDLLRILPNPWDEAIEAADWNLYLQLAKFHEKDVFVPLPMVLTSVYVHHFGRYSAKQKFEPLHQTFRRIEEVYSSEEIRRLWWGFSLPA